MGSLQLTIARQHTQVSSCTLNGLLYNYGFHSCSGLVSQSRHRRLFLFTFDTFQCSRLNKALRNLRIWLARCWGFFSLSSFLSFIVRHSTKRKKKRRYGSNLRAIIMESLRRNYHLSAARKTCFQRAHRVAEAEYT